MVSKKGFTRIKRSQHVVVSQCNIWELKMNSILWVQMFPLIHRNVLHCILLFLLSITFSGALFFSNRYVPFNSELDCYSSNSAMDAQKYASLSISTSLFFMQCLSTSKLFFYCQSLYLQLFFSTVSVYIYNFTFLPSSIYFFP